MTSDYITPQECDDLILALPQEYRPIVICAAETGFRIGDLCRAMWTDYDIQEQTLTLVEDKTGKVRTAAVTPRLKMALEAQRARQSCFEIYIFPGRDMCKPVSRVTVWRWIKRTWAHMFPGNERIISPHSMRKMYAVERRKSGAEIWEIQQDFNHDRDSTTIKYAFADILGREPRYLLKDL